MTEKPILFSGPMVRAILEGRKTQTRRVIKPQHWNKEGDTVNINVAPSASYMKGADGRMYFQFDHPRGGPLTAYVSRINPGDTLWVRETWADTTGMGFDHRVYYAADIRPASESDELRKQYGVKYRPSIHMPRWASRITLKVTEVRVQRLQDISQEDAIAEGCGVILSHPEPAKTRETFPVLAFRDLWKSIHGPNSWESNPWVAAISFERIT